MLRLTRSLLAAFALAACTLNFASADDWPQWRGPTRDGVWKESGLLESFPAEGLKPRWRQPIGSGYCGPTMADGRVFVTDRLVEPKQVERVHCFDFATGEKLWSHTYDCPYVGIGYQAGPRASVTIDSGRAYALGAMGNLHCFDAASGRILWQRDLNTDYSIIDDRRMPIWGIAASPLAYQDLIILHLGGADACIVALDAQSGKERWRALDDRASYASPILVEQDGKDVVVCWTGDSLSGLNPLTGETYWSIAFPPIKMPIGVATPILSDDRIFVTSFYDGALLAQLSPNATEAKQVWHKRGRSERDTDGLHSIISTPIFLGDYIYGVDSYGELRCLKADTGERIWEDLTATPKSRWSTIHFVQNGDRTWMFNERGELIIARLSPKGFDEISRTQIIAPTEEQLRQRGGVCWSHPAFAGRHIIARNDEEIVCTSLEAK
ncbi:PQQ-binding-like beta-propeller repeat protein [Lignipirellula cremea]|uniref:Outer membrane biogenesis protein BamB n=1 Tax=Lignipirellula cremea TaxID=2528010 RepID=A0A518DR85_9BACT|nr:PQQ-binding-like beta-propeller repeat protein [Lignipirellula cremea]QDU94334.1 outer membrane biogenesis protein BamB [Lignipirellula cremea]